MHGAAQSTHARQSGYSRHGLERDEDAHFVEMHRGTGSHGNRDRPPTTASMLNDALSSSCAKTGRCLSTIRPCTRPNDTHSSLSSPRGTNSTVKRVVPWPWPSTMHAVMCGGSLICRRAKGRVEQRSRAGGHKCKNGCFSRCGARGCACEEANLLPAGQKTAMLRVLSASSTREASILIRSASGNSHGGNA